MRFEDFINEGKVRVASKDVSLAKSLIKTADNDLKFLGKLKIDDESARKIMVNYYDVLRSIIEAISAIDGYKVYSHEAFTFFLIKKGDNLIAEKFDRFRKIRNKINYYGKNISPEETQENVQDIIKLIAVLKNKYLSNYLVN